MTNINSIDLIITYFKEKGYCVKKYRHLNAVALLKLLNQTSALDFNDLFGFSRNWLIKVESHTIFIYDDAVFIHDGIIMPSCPDFNVTDWKEFSLSSPTFFEELEEVINKT